MVPVITHISSKKLVGLQMNMSLARNKTAELWRSFMPRRGEITQKASQTDMLSMQVYPPSYSFIHIDIYASFEKRAVVEVNDFDRIPEGMERFVLPEGLYAVFYYKGPASDGARVFGHIFGNWLPSSEYAVDNRPHFEVLGEKYNHNNPDSEEEIWIPIRQKQAKLAYARGQLNWSSEQG